MQQELRGRAQWSLGKRRGRPGVSTEIVRRSLRPFFTKNQGFLAISRRSGKVINSVPNAVETRLDMTRAE